MDSLDFTEKKGEETLKYLRSSYDDLHERVHKLVTALVGGSGAVGAYSLAKMASPSDRLQAYSLVVLAVCWFLIAAVVALKAASSRDLSPGSGPGKVWKYFQARLAEFPVEREDRSEKALTTTREAEIALQQQRVSEYIRACSDRAIVLDRAYVAVAASPLAPLLAFAVLSNAK